MRRVTKKCRIVVLLALVVTSTPVLSPEVLTKKDVIPEDSTRAARSGGISTTLDNQIILELAPGDTADPNPVDLEGRTLVFTPDGHGGYSRSVQPLAWEDHLGEAVADEAVVELENFMFDFAGQRWGAFHVSRHGLLTFGAPFAWSYYRDGRFFTMREIAAAFVHSPTISPLYAPAFGDWRQGVDDRDSSRFVARWSDRIVVTWIVRDTQSYVRAVPTGPNRFQAVLHADGSVQFNYADITSGDGIAGLFSNVVQKGDLIASVVDATDPGVPGHLDLLDAAIYTSNTDAVIVEFTLRDSIREPPAGERYSYRLHFDTDEPYWNHPLDWSDEDATWRIDVREGGEYTAHGNGVRGFLAGKGEALISLLADASVLQGDGRGIRAMAVAGAAHFRGDQWVQGDYDSRALLQFLSPEVSRQVDLSTADRSFSPNQYEVFNNRGLPDLGELACRVIDNLGDEFDFMVFHNEFEVDSQEAGSPVSPYAYIPGTGTPKRGSPCGQGRLKALLVRPISMHTFYAPNLDNVLGQVAHEFGHVWSAYLSYSKGGRRESLVDDICRCHWRFELHTPAPFPPRGRQDAGSHMSVSPPGNAAGGGFWNENADGTFTPGRIHPELSGPSWLDLYLMGLADAHEVPDMFILRNLQPLNDGSGAYRADKETVTIEQIVAAEGPRVPSADDSQKVFNVGFVYLVERGQKPAADLLQLHARYIGELRDRWFGFTGERSRITTNVGPRITQEFPHFADGVWNGQSTTSDVVLVNVDTSTIHPAVYFYSPAGDLIAAESVVDVRGDLEVTVDGGVTTAIEPWGEWTLSTRGRNKLVTGSVRVISDGPIGGVLRFNDAIAGVAGVGAGRPVNDAIFPARRQAGGINTGAAIRNLGEHPITVRCQLLQAGNVRKEAEIPLAVNGQAAQFIHELFPDTDTSDFVGSVRCQTPTGVLFAGVALEMDFRNRIFTTLPVVPVPQVRTQDDTQLYFAHFANGASIVSDLVLVNVAGGPVRPAIYFYDQEGNPIAPASVIDVRGDLTVTEEGALTIGKGILPLGERTISTTGEGELRVGSVRVFSDGPIGGILRFDHPAVGVAGVGASLPLTAAVFPARRQADGINTGVAIRNLEQESIEVSCQLMQSGRTLETKGVELAGNGQTAQFIHEMFTRTDTSDFVGSVRCTAPQGKRFTGIALEMDAGSQIFTTLPVVPVQ